MSEQLPNPGYDADMLRRCAEACRNLQQKQTIGSKAWFDWVPTHLDELADRLDPRHPDDRGLPFTTAGAEAVNDLDLNDPDVLYMASRNHTPDERWTATGQLFAVVCDQCGNRWPCPTAIAIRERNARVPEEDRTA